MIHGGVRDTIALQLRKRAAAAPPPVGLRAAAAQAYVDTNCTGAPLPYHLVAADGLTMAAPPGRKSRCFQPGYRWDALVVFPEPGDYCILDEVSDRERQRQPKLPADAVARHRACRRRHAGDAATCRTTSRRS